MKNEQKKMFLLCFSYPFSRFSFPGVAGTESEREVSSYNLSPCTENLSSVLWRLGTQNFNLSNEFV